MQIMASFEHATCPRDEGPAYALSANARSRTARGQALSPAERPKPIQTGISTERFPHIGIARAGQPQRCSTPQICCFGLTPTAGPHPSNVLDRH